MGHRDITAIVVSVLAMLLTVGAWLLDGDTGAKDLPPASLGMASLSSPSAFDQWLARLTESEGEQEARSGW